MCGIIGAVAQRDVGPILLEGLKHLEYRGYDSAGLAIQTTDDIVRLRALGKVAKLDELWRAQPLTGSCGIAHTRWATHGEPSERNAHPHFSGHDIALVHNGIIENHAALRAELIKAGYTFQSETDSEIIAHLLHQELAKTKQFLPALKAALKKLVGAYALGIICAQEPQKLYAVRCGSPLVIGLGIGENFIASDPLALLPVTKQFIYLEEGDVAEICRHTIKIFDSNYNEVQREIRKTEINHETVNRGEFRHFMLKEIYEQPDAIQRTLTPRLATHGLVDDEFTAKLLKIAPTLKRIQIIACGTSYHAGMVAKFWLEQLAGLPTQVEVASEWRYRNPLVEPDTLFITVSQSGETADTLAALRLAKQLGYPHSLTICNVPESSLVREADLAMLTYAGPEIGVASTKAFTTQLVNFIILALTLGQARGLASERVRHLIQQLFLLPKQIEQTLQLNAEIQALAPQMVDKEHAFFVARHCHYPIVLEGALKLKEISYIHAEAYPAGELKHGPLALIDKETPVIALAPQNAVAEKLNSNLHEILARGAKLIVFADNKSDLENDTNLTVITLPESDTLLSPILYTIPLQLLAYHVAVLKGTDIDQPRNLAKSVTVE